MSHPQTPMSSGLRIVALTVVLVGSIACSGGDDDNGGAQPAALASEEICDAVDQLTTYYDLVTMPWELDTIELDRALGDRVETVERMAVLTAADDEVSTALTALAEAYSVTHEPLVQQFRHNRAFWKEIGLQWWYHIFYSDEVTRRRRLPSS